MKLFKHFIDLFLGKQIDVLQANGKKQSEIIDELEATMDGEDKWMLEKKDIIRYNCDCKEVE